MKYVSIPAEKCLAQRKNSSLPVTLGVFRYTLDREIRAIPVAMWFEGLKITPRAMLSRAVAGTRGTSLIINLPGSEKAAKENLNAVLGALEHAMHMIAAEGH